MFTGIVETVGTVAARERMDGGLRFRVRASALAESLEPGDSVAVDGVCQTVVARGDDWFAYEAGTRTLELTTLGDHEPGREVNLERALRAGEPIGGHLVQGHVDGVGAVRAVEPAGKTVYLRVALPAEVAALTAERGSVTVDGVSLTVHGHDGDVAELALIPYTWNHTTLRQRVPGDRVNVEADLIARYVRRLLEHRAGGETPGQAAS